MPGAFPGFQQDLLASVNNTVKAITEVVVCVFTRTSFMKMLADNPTLSRSLTFKTAEDEKFMQNNLINIATRPARGRLAYLLLEMHARVVRVYPQESGKDAYLPLTQQDIADTLGLSNVHVNRAIRSLRKEQIVSIGKNRLQIHDYEKLKRIAD